MTVGEGVCGGGGEGVRVRVKVEGAGARLTRKVECVRAPGINRRWWRLEMVEGDGGKVAGGGVEEWEEETTRRAGEF